MQRGATYLRALITRRCPLRCPYCHGEGEDLREKRENELSLDELLVVLHAGLENGLRKLKLLGGEPFLRHDLPELIRSLRKAAPDLDISAISCGVVDTQRLDACFEAGLSRCNVTIHGWTAAAFASRGGTAKMQERRRLFMEALVGYGRPVKVNYVYTGPEVEEDLAGLLDWAAGKPLVVNVLDDLHRLDIGPREIAEALQRLRGLPAYRSTDEDPDSLPTSHLHWNDGLEVELKDRHLGDHAPWHSCVGCEARARCREGIVALRLNTSGELKPCIDRPDLAFDLAPIVRHSGRAGVSSAWRRFIEREAA